MSPNHTSYAQFYRSEVSPLVGFVIMACGASAEDAWDATQSTFAIVWTKWSQVPADRRARKAWLRTTVVREFLRLIPDRRYRSGQEVPDRPDTDLAPEDVVALAESTARVRAVLDTLPPTQRLHLAWHLDGYTTAEIAKHTGKYKPAVRKNLSRALATLNAMLKEVPTDEQ